MPCWWYSLICNKQFTNFKRGVCFLTCLWLGLFGVQMLVVAMFYKRTSAKKPDSDDVEVLEVVFNSHTTSKLENEGST